MDRLHNIVKQIDKNDENVNILLTVIRNLGQQLRSLQQHAASFDESQYNSSATQLQAELEGSIPRIQDNLVQNDNLIQRMMDLFFELDAGPHLDKLSTEFGNYQQVHLEVGKLFFLSSLFTRFPTRNATLSTDTITRKSH